MVLKNWRRSGDQAEGEMPAHCLVVVELTNFIVIRSHGIHLITKTIIISRQSSKERTILAQSSSGNVP